MMRRATCLLGPHLVEYHEWHLHEPTLINYEGWRILDNVKMTPMEAWVTDVGGVGRHLDPIIDDPRLTHQQRVCRLYRWALKEIRGYISKVHVAKFNMAYKVVRQRFEKYRYVTDPAMCDMMVRETQKYLRETCNPHFMRNDHRNPNAPQNQTHPLFHPDHCQSYDPWTPVETHWYDDAKLHRYAAHHPMNSQSFENHERFGQINDVAYGMRVPTVAGVIILCLYSICCFGAVFHTMGEEDPYFELSNKYFQVNLRQAIEQEERARRSTYVTSYRNHDWDSVLGKTYPKYGYFKFWSGSMDKVRDMDVDPVLKGTSFQTDDTKRPTFAEEDVSLTQHILFMPLRNFPIENPLKA